MQEYPQTNDRIKVETHRCIWWESSSKSFAMKNLLHEPTIAYPLNILYPSLESQCNRLIFTKRVETYPIYTFTQNTIHSMIETMDHRMIRSKSARNSMQIEFKDEPDFSEFDLMGMPAASSSTATTTTAATSKSPDKSQIFVLPEIHYIPRPARKLQCQPTHLPNFLYGLAPKVQCNSQKM